MAKIKGPSILDYLQQVPEQSELHAYLLKVLKVSFTYTVMANYL